MYTKFKIYILCVKLTKVKGTAEKKYFNKNRLNIPNLNPIFL
jgi:hypothetical protein